MDSLSPKLGILDEADLNYLPTTDLLESIKEFGIYTLVTQDANGYLVELQENGYSRKFSS